MIQRISFLYGFLNAYVSVRGEVLYSVLIDFSVPVTLIKLIKMCLGGSCSKVRIPKNLWVAFPIQNGMKKKRCSIAIAFQLFFRISREEDPRKSELFHSLLVTQSCFFQRKSCYAPEINRSIITNTKYLEIENVA
jgi:hypothetical protein